MINNVGSTPFQVSEYAPINLGHMQNTENGIGVEIKELYSNVEPKNDADGE